MSCKSSPITIQKVREIDLSTAQTETEMLVLYQEMYVALLNKWKELVESIIAADGETIEVIYED